MALGALVMAWRTAQEYWVPSKKRIPIAKWSLLSTAQAVIDSGLAVLNSDGVYVAGSEEQFAWLFQRAEAGKKGGKASAAARKTKGKNSKHRLSTAEAKSSETNPLTLSLSLSHSQDSSSNSEIYSVGEGASAAPEIKNPIGYFIGTYAKAYKARYGKDARPEVGGRVQGRIKQFLDDTPIERACSMIQTYCEMTDSWFMTKGHDFETFMQNLSKVGLKLDTGRVTNSVQNRQQEVRDANVDAMREYLAGKGGA